MVLQNREDSICTKLSRKRETNENFPGNIYSEEREATGWMAALQ